MKIYRKDAENRSKKRGNGETTDRGEKAEVKGERIYE